MNDHEKVLRGDVPGMARAWLDVTDLLDELVPGWSNTDLLGRDAAIAAIRGLAAIGERGEPALWQFQDREGNWHNFINEAHRQNTLADGTWPIRALCVLPTPPTQGAQPNEEKGMSRDESNGEASNVY